MPRQPGGGQRIIGNQNVQIQDAKDSWIQVVYDSRSRVLPLESAQLSIASLHPSPARLISARAGVFPYVGRAELLAELEGWTDAPLPFSGRVIAGPGGSGKTRLAVELCLQLRERDWVCGFLARSDGEGRLDALVEVPTARLVVIDYAETRPDQLELLLPQLSASASPEAPVRVLLLVRTGPARPTDVAKRLGERMESLESVIEACETRVLDEAAPLDETERRQLFEGAVPALAAHLDVAPAPAAPPDLSHEVFASPLMVVIAAYLAAQGEDAPAGRVELLEEVLRHERRYWREGAADLDADEELLERVVALATLVTASGEPQAAERLRLLPDLHEASRERRNRLSRWARDQYPGPRWWNPLEPDLLGEHLVGRCFTDQPEVLRGALAGEEPEEITRPLEVLARAAADHPELAKALAPILSGELERLCKIAVAQAASVDNADLFYGDTVMVAAALEPVISAVDLDLEALNDAVELMPRRDDVVLNELSSSLTLQLTALLRPRAEADAAYAVPLAAALNNLSLRLADAGRAEEALAAIEEAVGIWRQLEEGEPDERARNLAIALNNRSLRLADAGRDGEALEAIEEAVATWQALADEAPARHTPDLAISLNNLSLRLSDAGRVEEAVKAAEGSVDLRRPFAAADPAHAPGLARALNNLSVNLADAKRPDDALAAIEESLQIWQRLADANPAGYAPELAKSLSNRSNRLAQAGRLDEALAQIEEALKIWRALADVNAAYAPDLARAIVNLHLRQVEAGDDDEALATIEEAVALWRTLSEGHPASAAGLARTLLVLAAHLERRDEEEAAERARSESAELS